MRFQPRLRADVTVESRPEGGAILHDPVLDRRINLGAISLAIAQRLDGATDADQVIDAVCALDPSWERSRVEQTLRTLLLLSAVEGAGAAIVERMARIRRGDLTLTPVTLPGARFACQGSGQCCKSYRLGPLEDEDLARLAPLDLARAFPHLAGRGFHHGEERPGGRALRFLDREGAACTFLLPDQRCGIHAHFGVEMKPGFCRLYPYEFVYTVDGIRIYDRGSCSTFAVSSRSGPSLVEDLPRIESLLPKRNVLDHPIVMLDPSTPCDYGHFLALQDALCRRVERGATPSSTAAVSDAGAYARRCFEAIAACPIAPCEPDATVARLVADHSPAPPPDPASVELGLQSVAVIASDLLRGVAPTLVKTDPTSAAAHLIPHMAREIGHILHLLIAISAERLSPGALPLPDHVRRVMAVSLDEAAHGESLRLSLRQDLFGTAALIENRALPAQLRIAISHLVCWYGAKLHAAAQSAPQVRSNDLNFGHTIAQHILTNDHIAPLFLAHEDRTWPVLDALPSLV